MRGITLLQQLFVSADLRIGVEPRFHAVACEPLTEGCEDHSLVVRHESSDDHGPLVVGRARWRVVDRLVESKPPLGTLGREETQICGGRRRVDHKRKCSRVWSDDEVVRKPALEPEFGHAERSVLVVPLDVARIECSLGNPPRHAIMSCIRDLLANGCSFRLLQKCAFVCPHHERRHQILEHGSRPGNERAAATGARQRTPQPLPVRRGNVALAYSDKAAEARLAGQQVIVRRIVPRGVDAVTNREQLSPLVKQKAKVHVANRVVHLGGYLRAPRPKLHDGPLTCRGRVEELADPHACLHVRPVCSERVDRGNDVACDVTEFVRRGARRELNPGRNVVRNRSIGSGRRRGEESEPRCECVDVPAIRTHLFDDRTSPMTQVVDLEGLSFGSDFVDRVGKRGRLSFESLEHLDPTGERRRDDPNARPELFDTGSNPLDRRLASPVGRCGEPFALLLEQCCGVIQTRERLLRE